MKNKATLTGYVGRDPEIRILGTGKKVANIRLATSEKWKDKQTGERKEKTEWHSIVCFNEHITGVIEQYVKKGSLIEVEGMIRTRKWQDQAGQEKYTTEIVIEAFKGDLMLFPGSGGGDGNRAPPADDDSYGERRNGGTSTGGGDFGSASPMEGRRLPPPAAGGSRYSQIDDDIPF